MPSNSDMQGILQEVYDVGTHSLRTSLGTSTSATASTAVTAPPVASAAVIQASAARTTLQTGSDITNTNNQGLHLIINVTSITASPSLVFILEGKAATANVYYTLIQSAAITATGTTVLKIYPGISAVANASVSDVLPSVWRLRNTVANSNSMTYSTEYVLLP